MYETAIQLVSMGFHGVSVVMFFLAYRLFRDLVSSKNSADANLLKIRLRGVHVFLLFTIVFFLAGVSAEFFRRAQETDARMQENNMLIMVSPPPARMPKGITDPIILIGATPLSLDSDTGLARVLVKNGDTFTFQLFSLTEELKRLVNLVNVLRTYQSVEPEGGADDI